METNRGLGSGFPLKARNRGRDMAKEKQNHLHYFAHKITFCGFPRTYRHRTWPRETVIEE